MPLRGFLGIKCHPGVFGHQMPPGGIGVSNATRGYWGVKCHPQFTGASKANPRLLGRQRPEASKIRGVKGPYMGKGRKGHKASEFRESKFGRQGSRRQRSQVPERVPKWVPKCVPKWVPKWVLNGDPRNGIQKILKNLKNCSGRQMPLEIIGASNAIWRYWGVKCHLGVLGRQMPPGGIGASNATRGYWGVKGQGRQRARKPHGVKNQGRQRALYG